MFAIAANECVVLCTAAIVASGVLWPAAGDIRDSYEHLDPTAQVAATDSCSTSHTMETNILDSVSALVLLVSARGARSTGARPGSHVVAEDVIDEVTQHLRAFGFEVHTGGPIALTITGSVATFERVFCMELEITGGASAPSRVVAKTPAVIPPELTRHVEHIVFPTPAETFP